MKNISILGSTGSIGVNTLNIVRRHPAMFRVMGLSAGENIDRLKAQIQEFRPRMVSVATEQGADRLIRAFPLPRDFNILIGVEGCRSVATIPEVDLVVSAMVGSHGLLPTMDAINQKKTLALANKESLVMAGEIVMTAARTNKVAIIPVDSEHSAIFQCIRGNRRKEIRRIILTASGGPFLGMSAEQIRRVTPEEALCHPRWKMGKKITIDSATMMNKGFEILEAKWLFDMDYDAIGVYIHPESIVHSLVEYRDGSILAQLGLPDMKLPIAYALSYPARLESPDGSFLDLDAVGPLQFMKADPEKIPALALAYHAGRCGGTLPAVMNGANEKAVEAFLHRRISFYEILDIVEKVMSMHHVN
ncbi:MAG: 1-deoxy-D-xylulose-5-phosphate reductoisomerase, partial [Deltaproteobacteria bacterium]|nr:1-deoxy-D-xylulose-5-phosphate reductoisomerase [Deltaproteobacteria bacterium]